MLGGSSPRTQVKVSVWINFGTLLVGTLLLGFLKGHYDALFEKTGQPTPRIIYLIYTFLGLVSAWQLLGFIINTRLYKKLDGAKRGKVPPDSNSKSVEGALPTPMTRRSLERPDGADETLVRAEQGTTKILDKTPRE